MQFYNFKNFNLFFFTAMALTLAGCGAGKDKPSVELIQDMMNQISLKAQDYDEIRNEPAVRLPPENTKPRGYKFEKFTNDPIAAEQNLKSPFDNPMDEKVLARGKIKYNIYCAICHGVEGRAADDSPMKAYIPLIPSLVSDKVKNYKDGRIYHIITHGQGVMGAYSSQIPHPEDRWAVVSYIRTLTSSK